MWKWLKKFEYVFYNFNYQKTPVDHCIFWPNFINKTLLYIIDIWHFQDFHTPFGLSGKVCMVLDMTHEAAYGIICLILCIVYSNTKLWARNSYNWIFLIYDTSWILFQSFSDTLWNAWKGQTWKKHIFQSSELSSKVAE